MRRLLSIALIGLAVATVATDASAQARGRGQPGLGRRPGLDTARARRVDSLRVARGDTLRRRGSMDSLRAARMDSAGRGRGGRPGDMPNARFMLGGIQLTDAEKANVKAINERYAEEFKGLRPADGQRPVAPDPDRRAKLQQLTERQRADIRAALTPEHQAQFDANVARGSGRRGGPPPDGAGLPPARGRRPPLR